MIAEDLRAQGDGVAGGDGGIRPDLEGQLVIVGHIAHTGVLHGVVDLVDRRVDRVHGNGADGHGRVLVPIRGDIAPAMAQRDLHAEAGVGPEGADVQLGIQYFHLAVGLDVARRDLAFAHGVDIDGLGAFAVQPGDQTLHIQDDLRHILTDAGDGRELVLNAGDLDGSRRGAGQGRQQNSAQGVAQGGAVSALQRLYHIFAISAVLRRVKTFNTPLFNFNHKYTLLIILRSKLRSQCQLTNKRGFIFTWSTAQRSGAPRSRSRCLPWWEGR